MPSKKTLDEALHVRLLIDNPKRLDFIDWVNGNWRQANLGKFYQDEDVLDNAIFEATQAVLAAEGRTLPNTAANQLRNDVNRATMPEDAVIGVMVLVISLPMTAMDFKDSATALAFIGGAAMGIERVATGAAGACLVDLI